MYKIIQVTFFNSLLILYFSVLGFYDLNAQTGEERVYPLSSNRNISPGIEVFQLKKTPYTHKLLKSYSEIRDESNGRIAYKPGSINYTLGEEQNFYTRNVLNPQQWYELTATLKILENNIAIWFSNQEIDTSYDEAMINNIMEHLNQYTANGSINTEMGVLNILETFFGHPPNSDGSGLVHILFLDIPDNFEQTGSFVAGFFDPVNVFDHEFSNGMDLIYIDLNPTLYNQGEIHLDRTIATIAHEIQHLIHINYEGDKPQNLFINEGLSELAEIITGHQPREAASYLRSFNRPLFSWSFENPIPDYSRASLFMHYVYERVGPEFIRPLIQTTDIGEVAFKNALKQTSPFQFDELFKEWGLVLFAETGIPEHIQYSHQARNGIIYPRDTNEIQFPHTGLLAKGRWIHQPVTFPLSEQVELISDQWTSATEWTGLEYSPDGTEVFTGTLTFPAVSASSKNHTSLSLLFTQLDTGYSSEGMITYMADGVSSGQPVALAHGNGQPQAFTENASFLLLNNGVEIGTVYNVSERGWIRSIRFRSIFLNELYGSELPQSAERSVFIDIYSFNDGKFHKKLIPTIHHTVQRPFGNLSFETVFLDDFYDKLSDYHGRLFVTIRSGTDSENNTAIGMNLSDSGNSNTWFKAVDKESWRHVNDFTVQNNTLDGWDAIIEMEYIETPENARTLPLDYRAEADAERTVLSIGSPVPVDWDHSTIVARLPTGKFVSGKLQQGDEYTSSIEFPVSVGGDYRFYGRLQEQGHRSKIPVEWQWTISDDDQFKVAQNYPNPFNPSTTIPFTLLEAATVKVDVFDLLGRRVRRLQPDDYPSGNHTVSVDLTGFTSGSYFVRIAISRPDGRGNAIRTKKLMMIK